MRSWPRAGRWSSCSTTAASTASSSTGSASARPCSPTATRSASVRWRSASSTSPEHDSGPAVAQSPAMARDPRIERGMLAQLTERRRRIEAGEASLGWKLGVGVPAAMAKLRTDAPLVGYLLEPARVDDGAAVSLDGWSHPKLEPEIAVHLGADLAPGASREQAEAAIAGLGVAIELVDLDPGADDPEAILAADIFQRHVLLGPVVEGAGASGVSARALVNGEEAAATEDATE